MVAHNPTIVANQQDIHDQHGGKYTGQHVCPEQQFDWIQAYQGN